MSLKTEKNEFDKNLNAAKRALMGEISPALLKFEEDTGFAVSKISTTWGSIAPYARRNHLDRAGRVFLDHFAVEIW